MIAMPKTPWKSHPMARQCHYEKCPDKTKPGMQPLRLNGKRAFWHLKCFEKERAALATAERGGK
jgi:hypothetical protein